MHEDICYLDATELAHRIRTKALSPLEVARAHLARIEALNPSLNAIVTMMDGVEERARAAEKAVMRGERLGPLHGVPYTIKDCVDTAGVRTTRGSRIFADRVPSEDATVVQRMNAAGAIALGKTNMPEFALWWETGNLVFGRTSNPWNLARTTGGSSGGEAAALAAGLSAMGIGSDVGGSIRAPGHYCGIVGFKPTHGLVPLTGHFPETLLRFMHVGPMARTVRDAALGLSIMAGPDGRDWYALPVPPGELPSAPAALPRLRVGVMAERGFGPVHDEVIRTVTRAGEALGSLGCAVEPVVIEGLARRDCNLLSLALFGPEGGAYFAPMIRGREDELHPVLRRRLALPSPTLEQYVAAEAEMEGLRRDLLDYFSRYDLLVCPTALVPAHPHEMTELVLGSHTLPPRHVLRATIPFDLTGSPAISVPFGWTDEGLPIGVQLVGRKFDDALVLRAALALESLHDTSRRHPALS